MRPYKLAIYTAASGIRSALPPNSEPDIVPSFGRFFSLTDVQTCGRIIDVKRHADKQFPQAFWSD